MITAAAVNVPAHNKTRSNIEWVKNKPNALVFEGGGFCVRVGMP
jgi:hypothetical protein